MTGIVMYEDEFGAMIDYPDDDYVEIRWYDASAGFDRDSFNNWLAGFAGGVEHCQRSGILVDAIQFRMDMANMDGEWRDANIIPRYNEAGVKRFAFLMPEGMPAIGAPPAADGPADFPTAYFGTRADAKSWLAS